ncbi:prephenate dehydrogenase [Methyloglobulus sp.]|uniref:prephenate dehydrogenase n=1 Tax=Methyloglobulus sp. TaxID=2518622 RepID=UPI00398A4C4B
MFNKLCIIGVGLIGGSIARAARQCGLSKTIVGFGREGDLPNLQTGKDLGVIDDYCLDISEAVLDADCIIMATPVGAIESVFTLLKPYWNEIAIYTDVGSTKGNVIAAAERVFGYVPDNLVPAHPIAGAEQSGVVASLDDLFINKRLIITPDKVTRPDAVQKMREFWERLGTQVAVMDAGHHDAVLAATSHLPHIVAFAMVDMLGHKDEQSEIFKYAAGGFRDFTRIASSDPTMWLDICVANKNEIMPLIQQLKDELDKIQQFLDSNDNQQLYNTFTYAGKARQRFLDLFEN